MFNVCIVGYGAIGPVHKKAIDDTANARVYAVCDCNENKLSDISEKIIKYTNFDDVLRDRNIDAVHICTPHYLHFEMAKKALQYGKRVVLEKPAVMKSEEFESLLKLSGDVAVVFQNRQNNCVKELKNTIDRQIYGDIKGIKAVLTWHRTAEYYKKDLWRGKWETEGGGVVINQAIHVVDLVCYLTGGVKSVEAKMANVSLSEIEVEDTCFADFELLNGGKGIFFATNSYAEDSPIQIDVAFENGTAEYKNGRLYVNGELKAADITTRQGKSYWGAGHAELIDNIYSKNKIITPQDIKNTMRTVFAIYESAKKDKRVNKIADTPL